MRYRDFASSQETTYEERLRTATLYLLDQTEWAVLAKIREATGPSRIIAVRSLAPRFRGFSVDIMCKDVDAAWELFGNWHDRSIRKICQTAAEEENQGAARPHD